MKILQKLLEIPFRICYNQSRDFGQLYTSRVPEACGNDGGLERLVVSVSER